MLHRHARAVGRVGVDRFARMVIRPAAAASDGGGGDDERARSSRQPGRQRADIVPVRVVQTADAVQRGQRHRCAGGTRRWRWWNGHVAVAPVRRASAQTQAFMDMRVSYESPLSNRGWTN